MKLELEQADIEAIAGKTAQEVLKALKPLLEGKGQEESIFTVKGLAKHLHVSEKWVYERVQFREIPFIKAGGNVRFSKKDIDRWLDTLKTPVVNRLSSPLKAVK